MENAPSLPWIISILLSLVDMAQCPKKGVIYHKKKKKKERKEQKRKKHEAYVTK